MSILQKLKDATVPSLYSAAASAAIWHFCYDNNFDRTPVFGIEIPIIAVVAGASFIGSEAGGLITEFVVPKIPIVKDIGDKGNLIIPPLAAGLATYATMAVLVSPNTDLMTSLILGSAGSFVGNLAYNTI